MAVRQQPRCQRGSDVAGGAGDQNIAHIILAWLEPANHVLVGEFDDIEFDMQIEGRFQPALGAAGEVRLGFRRQALGEGDDRADLMAEQVGLHGAELQGMFGQAGLRGEGGEMGGDRCRPRRRGEGGPG